MSSGRLVSTVGSTNPTNELAVVYPVPTTMATHHPVPSILAHSTFATATPNSTGQRHEPLPRTLARPDDKLTLSSHQVLLRHQIEVFQVTKEDLKAPTKGRNKQIRVGQVGIRCRHCKNTPAARRQRGSMYFPHCTMGIYQAAQNMSSPHLQCGLCHAMPSV
jgi:hypothetical protein